MNDKYLYYPGCSMESSAKAYSESLAAICEPIGHTSKRSTIGIAAAQPNTSASV
jgi:hypothetical protein